MPQPEDSPYAGLYFITQKPIAETSHRYSYCIPVPYMRIGDISNPQNKKKLVEKIWRCIHIMLEVIDELPELLSASSLGMHIKVGPLIRELERDGVMLPKGIKAKDALEVLQQVVKILEKKRPKQTPEEDLIHPQFLQEIDELKQALRKPDSILCTKLKGLKDKLNDMAPCYITIKK